MNDPGVRLDTEGSSEIRTLTPSLLGRLREQDPQAWRRMTDLYGPLVHLWCRKANVPAEDAADVWQEVFGSVHEKLPSFVRDKPGDHLGAWIRVIARSKIGDYWRRREKQPGGAGGTHFQEWLHMVPEPDDPSSDGKAPTTETAELLQRALGQVLGEFTEKTRQAFRQVALEGRAPAAVAHDLGMTRGAVHIAKCRVLKRFRDEFQDVFGWGDDR